MVRLREVTRADIPALAEVVHASQLTHRDWAGPQTPVTPIAEEELEWELRFARAGAWIRAAEEDDGRIVGAVAFARGTVSREDRTPVPGLAHVSAVFVHPDRWRRGIAALMLDAAVAAMREQGYERAQLWTLAGSPAERLYAAAGWRADGRREEYPPMGLETVAYVIDVA